MAGVEPVLGRWHREAGTGEVVLGHGMWRRVFGADPGVLGTRLQIGVRSLEVVGIAPARFRGLLLSDPLDLWLPIREVATVHSRFGNEVLSRRHWHVFDVFARLAPEVGVESASGELAVLAARLSEEDPGGGARTLPLVTLWDRSVGDSTRAINTLGSIIGTLVLALLVLVVVSAGGLVVARSAERWRALFFFGH